MRRRGSYVQTIGSQIEIKLLALRPGRVLPRGRFLLPISVTGLVDSSASARLLGLVQLKNPIASSGIEIATSRLVV
jgi:hypothetical protein